MAKAPSRKRTSAKAAHTMPAVLSFQRSTLVTDAMLYSQDASGTLTPVMVVDGGFRGTINIAGGRKAAREDDNGEQAALAPSQRPVVQVQKRQSARLNPDAVALVVRFGLKFLPMSQALHACAGASDEVIAKTRRTVSEFIKRFLDSEAAERLAKRYARNVLNARWLWRNRVLAARVTVSVFEVLSSAQQERLPLASVDALKVPLGHFDDPTEVEVSLATRFASGLRGQGLEGFEVEAVVDFGTKGAVEVFPSQVYDGVPREHKSIRDPSRVLYMHKRADADRSIGELGHAAIRDAKINNALRTFDTWYPDFDAVGLPMPIEPEGASIDMQAFFRKQGRDGKSAFDLIRKLETLDPTSDDGLFMAAALIRAGVYGGMEWARTEQAGSQAGGVAA